MKHYQIIFSPTGGTQKVSDILSQELNDSWSVIDLTDNHLDFSSFKFGKDDVCMVAVPSFCGRVPEIAIERLSKMQANETKAILICVYGNREYDDTLAELEQTLLSCGFIPVAGVASIAEHSMVRSIATGRPDNEDALELKEFAKKIKEIINYNQTKAFSFNKKSPLIDRKVVPLKPKASNECVECGLCAKKCPVGAIDFKNLKTCDENKCISCMRCIEICPYNARYNEAKLMTSVKTMLEKKCLTRKDNQFFS